MQTVSGNNKYFLHGTEAPLLELLFGHKYIFTFPAAHPLRLSRDADGTHGGGSAYDTGAAYGAISAGISASHKRPFAVRGVFIW